MLPPFFKYRLCMFEKEKGKKKKKYRRARVMNPHNLFVEALEADLKYFNLKKLFLKDNINLSC